MIFLTVGHQMPFDRLVRAVDAWAALRGRSDLFAQIADGTYVPKAFQSTRFLDADAYQRRVQEASAIVAHAGTGTIIAALQLGKPLLVLPRRSELGETRNDHQVATAKHFVDRRQVIAVENEAMLPDALDAIERFKPAGLLGSSASPELLARVRAFVFNHAK